MKSDMATKLAAKGLREDVSTADLAYMSIVGTFMMATSTEYMRNLQAENPSGVLIPLFLPKEVVEGLEYLLQSPEPLPRLVCETISIIFLCGVRTETQSMDACIKRNKIEEGDKDA